MTTKEMLFRAKNAVAAVPELTEEIKNRAIYVMAERIEAHTEPILEANRRDTDAAKDRLSASMLDRLRLDEKRIKQMSLKKEY